MRNRGIFESNLLCDIFKLKVLSILKEKIIEVRALAEYISEAKNAQKKKKNDELMCKCDFESLFVHFHIFQTILVEIDQN
jgi:hypothetical protein